MTTIKKGTILKCTSDMVYPFLKVGHLYVCLETAYGGYVCIDEHPSGVPRYLFLKYFKIIIST